MRVKFPRKLLPVLRDCDLVIEGGTFAGISAALMAAGQGKKVVLIEHRTYLGWEMTACLRPWMETAEIDSERALPDVISALLTPQCSKRFANEIVFDPDQVKIRLEDLLFQAGVVILYASRVIGAFGVSGGLRGVVIGNKSGRQVIRCKEGLRFVPHNPQDLKVGDNLPDVKDGMALIWRSLEFTGIDLSDVTTLPSPSFLEVGSERLRVHHGFVNDHHWYVEYPVSTWLVSEAHSSSEREYFLQMLAAQTTKYLLDHEKKFQGAYWVRGSEESFPASIGLLEFIAQAVPETILPQGEEAGSSENESCPACELDAFAESAAAYENVLAFSLPANHHVNVLVVGGGTSGVAAAMTAASDGMKTIVVEMNSRVGGTGTIGGVQSYWFGRNAGYSARRMKVLEDAHHEFNQPLPQGEIPRWNIELKSWILLKSLHQSDVEVLLNSQVIATVVSDQTIHGVVLASNEGLQTVDADFVIDATGDGDLAVFSGVPFSYGSVRNGSTMWCSLAQFSEPGQTQNHFTNMVDVGNIEDYTRAILSGRRHGQGTVDHGAYLAMRESRHILGETTLTLTDALRHKKYDDVILVAFSNYDVKGHTDSDWLRVGLIPPNLEVEIPLRAILPRGLEHLIVIGKAISVSHDAQPMIRMQRDMENLGAAAGWIAAMAVRERRSPSDLPFHQIQQKLVTEELLPPDILNRLLLDLPVDVQQLLMQLDGNRPLYSYSDMGMQEVFKGTIPFVEICCAGSGAIPQVREAFHHSCGARQLLLAQALALMGENSGLAVLINAVEEQLKGEHLPERVSAIRNTQLPPDQGAMPDVVYWLYSLGMLRDERMIPVLDHVVKLIHRSSVEDFYSQSKGTFYYIDAVCFAAEKLGSKHCIDFLLTLQQTPFLSHNVCKDPFQEDYVRERIAFLELSMARAMLRCAMPEGLSVAISYLEDTRVPLRDHAYALLLQFTGRDLKLNISAWMEWYQKGNWVLTAHPDATLTDAQKAWTS